MRALCAIALLVPALARAETRVPVRVVDVAGGRAYLEPGEKAGVRRGVQVVLRGRRLLVVEATATHAAVDDATLRVGDRGEAVVVGAGAPAPAPRPPPAPLSRYIGQWPEARPPAATQRVRHVPLGGAPGAAVRLAVTGQSLVIVPRAGRAQGHVALGARLSVEPWRDRPLGLDADGAALLWLGDDLAPAGGARPFLDVRELRLRYGAAADPYAAAGRLRWAARATGVLDGVRVRTPAYRGFTLAAFGGLVPDPLSGKPSSESSRFGAELAWQAPRAHAALAAWGSTFAGAIDERRLALLADAARGPVFVDARAEVALRDALELTVAGAGASLRLGAWRADARLDARRPERSRYLDSLLPGTWLCPDGVCDELRVAGTLLLGWQRRPIALSVGGTQVGDSDTSLFADARVAPLFRRGRLDLGLSGTNGSFVDQRTLRAGAGVDLGPLDLEVTWRGAMLSYRAATRTFLQHQVSLEAAWAWSSRMDLVVGLEGATGPDVDALALLATFVWRPLP